MATLIPAGESRGATVVYKDARGNAAKVDGPPVWSSSNEAIVTVAARADAMSATVTAAGVGSAQISVRADADLDAGKERELIATADVEVVAGEAVVGEITLR
jgi:uncharacterized protein YjdB